MEWNIKINESFESTEHERIYIPYNLKQKQKKKNKKKTGPVVPEIVHPVTGKSISGIINASFSSQSENNDNISIPEISSVLESDITDKSVSLKDSSTTQNNTTSAEFTDK